MVKEEKDLDASDEPDAVVEFLFVDKDFNQEEIESPITGTFYESIELFFTGKNKNDDLATFKMVLPLKINSRAEELIFFQGRVINLSAYKYGVIDEDKTITEFDAVDESFFKALKKTQIFVVVGKEFDLAKFKTHKVFNDFYNFVYGIFDEEKIMESYVEADATVEYLFIEKAETQLKPINDDQGYMMGFINLFFTGQFKNDNLTAFKALIEDELSFSAKEYDFFKNKFVDFNDYKFVLVDNDKNFIEFNEMDAVFFEALKKSLRNLMIVGTKFDIEKFKYHEIFDEWFDTYTNRT